MIPLLTYTLIVSVITGIFGIGTGLLLVPVLLHFNFTFQQAIAISLLLQTIPNSFPGVYLYWKEGHLPLKKGIIIAIVAGIGIFIGSYIGSKKLIPQKYLNRSFVVIAFIIATYLLFTLPLH
jgi:uncharacterized protein